MEEGNKICTSFRIYLNLNNHQFKISIYSYISTFINHMVTTNQKTTIDTQNLERNEHKHTIKKNHQNIREETKRRKEQKEPQKKKEKKKKKKTSNKMGLSTYLSVITSNVNALNAPIKRHRVADCIKKNKPHLYVIHTHNGILVI